MMPKPPKPSPPSTAKSSAAANSKSTKLGPRPTVSAVAVVAAAAVVMPAVVAAADSPTRITANPRANRANPAGSSRFSFDPVLPDLRGGLMSATFLKPSKELKGQEKQRVKAEKSARKKRG